MTVLDFNGCEYICRPIGALREEDIRLFDPTELVRVSPN
jgi:hypothetical protein